MSTRLGSGLAISRYYSTMITSPKRVYALVSVALVIIIILGFLYVRAVPVRLIGLKVFEGAYLSGKVHSFGITGFHEKKIKVSGTLADYASSGGVAVALVRNAETNSVDVMMLSPKAHALTSDGGGKASVSVSPDGTMVAYAALTNAPSDTYFTAQLSAWSIKVLDVKTGEVTLMGTGFGPEFFTNNGKLMLLFTGPTGITVADVALKTSQTTFFLNPGVIDYAAHISRDGKYVAIPNGLTKNYELFSVTHIEAPIGLNPLGHIQQTLVHGAFNGDTFYGVEREPSGAAHVWRFTPKTPLSGAKTFDLPMNALYRIIP